MTKPPTNNNVIGIIDIGSNSIRLVLYGRDTDSSRPQYLFEDKAICQLAKGMGKLGKLAKPRFECALEALSRFRQKLDILKVNQLHVIATSAVRSAKNGDDFVQQAEDILNAPVVIIPGEEEARLSALGVSFSFPQAVGIVADLGGGSLELASLNSGEVADMVSFELGHQRLIEFWEAANWDIEALNRRIRQDIDQVGWLKQHKNQSLFLVGSSFRRLGKRYLASVGKPGDSINGLTLSGRHTDRLIDRFVSAINHLESNDWLTEPREELKVVVGAFILLQLIQRQKPKNVVISATGVREGVLLSL